jgi:hypothetical protein
MSRFQLLTFVYFLLVDVAGHAIDQGIAYFLLLLALVLTYLIPMDAYPNFF